MKKKLLLAFALILTNINAQKKTNYNNDSLQSLNRWSVGIAFSAVENRGETSGNPINNFLAFEKEDANNGLPVRVNIEYRMHELFGFEFSGSLNRWNANEGILDSRRITKDYNYFALDAGARFYVSKLLLDRPLNWGIDPDWFDLYLMTGIGYFKINDGGVTGNIGVGANIWISEHLGVHGSWVSKWALDQNPAKYDTNHMQVALGLAYRFSNKDKDGDGVRDYIDHCPNTPGTKEGKGCPDDGVLIVDNTKIDPINYDTDNDGIADSADACPDIAGSSNYNGCPVPDSDGDGVLDNVDDCPQIAGLIANEGCPIIDTDNDEVIDSEDNCPEIFGLESNNGCPEAEIDAPLEMTKISKQIRFITNKDTFTPKTYLILQDIISFVKKYPNSKFRIEGHTDSIGSYKNNKTLSQKRANSVKAYLISKGISAFKLEAIGMGERKPIESNMYHPGRKINRRVEIIQVN